jgi:hypothetical protein
MTRIPPFVRNVRLAHPDKVTLPEAARQIGVSAKRVRSLIGNPDLPGIPANYVQAGTIEVAVYSQEEVAKVRDYINGTAERISLRSDPKEQEARRENRKARARLHSRAYYYRQQRAAAVEAGDDDAVARYDAQLDQVSHQLAAR